MDRSTIGMVGKSEEDYTLQSPRGTNQFYANAGAGQRVHPRRTKRDVPVEEKDDRYWEKRKRNNEAARRSRENKRRLDFDIRGRTTVLEEENALLRKEIQVLKSKFGLSFDHRFTGLDKQGELLSEPIAVSMNPPDFNGLCPVSPPSLQNRQQMGSREDILASPLNPRYDPTRMTHHEPKYESQQNGKVITPVKGSPPPYYPHPAYPYAGTYWGSPPQAHSQSHLLSSPQMARTALYPPMPGPGVMDQHMAIMSDAYAHSPEPERMHSTGHQQHLQDAPESHSLHPAHYHPSSSQVNNHTQSSFYDYQPSYYHPHTPDKQNPHSAGPADLRNKHPDANSHYSESDSSQDSMNSAIYSKNLKMDHESRHMSSDSHANTIQIVPSNCNTNKAKGSEEDLLQENNSIRNRFPQLTAEVEKKLDGVSPHLTQSNGDHC